MTSNSQTVQMTSESSMELEEKDLSGTSNSPETDSSLEEKGQAEVDIVQPRRTKLETGILMSTLCMAVFLAALDFTIVTTALPTISEHFHSTSGYTWVGSAFLLAASVVAPIWAKFSDIFGRKVILLITIVVFFLGSALCGTAVSFPMLIVGRSIQGVGAGGLLALVNVVVGDLFPQRERGTYYGIIGMVWAVAFTLGPLVGGAFTKNVSWRWCFYVNLPISGTAFCIIAFMLKLKTPKTPILAGIKAIDWIGSLTLVGGLLMFLLGLEFGGTVHPWNSVIVICLIVFGVVTIIIFVALEQYFARYPVVPMHLYTNISNLAILAVNLFQGIVLTGCTYFLPLYCQAVLGSSPLLSGVLLLPFAAALSIGAVGSGIYLRVTGRYLDCIYLGFFSLILGLGLFYDLPDSKTWSKIVIYQMIAGFGVGLLFQPPLIALQNSVPAQDNATATASFALVRNVASALGVVIGSVAFSNKMNTQQDLLIDALGVSTAKLFSGSNAQANIFAIETLNSSQKEIVRKAFWVSLRSIWLVAVCLGAVGSVFSLLIRKKKLNKTHEEVQTGLAGEEERRRILLEQKAGKTQAKPEIVSE